MREPAPAQETTTTPARLAARPRPVDDDDMAAIVDGERLDNPSERMFSVHRRIHTSQANIEIYTLKDRKLQGRFGSILSPSTLYRSQPMSPIGQVATNSKRAKLVGSPSEGRPIVDRCGLFSLGPAPDLLQI
jgi:hypothetical protein